MMEGAKIADFHGVFAIDFIRTVPLRNPVAKNPTKN